MEEGLLKVRFVLALSELLYIIRDKIKPIQSPDRGYSKLEEEPQVYV